MTPASCSFAITRQPHVSIYTFRSNSAPSPNKAVYLSLRLWPLLAVCGLPVVTSNVAEKENFLAHSLQVNARYICLEYVIEFVLGL